MTEETKKYLAIGLVVICLGFAGVMFYRTLFDTGPVKAEGMSALLCTQCGGFEIPADEFRELMNKKAADMLMPGQTGAMECPKCGQKSCYTARKCTRCESIFAIGQAKDLKYPDRCPKCGFSMLEDRQKNR
jgi:DNA-directed RNA polymerase subunit RPC12/RpoP